MFFQQNGGPNGESLTLYCTICTKYVQERTKHCASCNRCCSNFDHHCEWLNNCIGKTNYDGFRTLIGWLSAYIAWGGLLLVPIFTSGKMADRDKVTGRLRWYGICIYVEIAVTVPTFIFLL
jgi:hypothetical protein